MSGAVTVPCLTMMTSTVFEETLGKDTHTQIRSRFYLKICKVAYDFANKKRGYVNRFTYHSA